MKISILDQAPILGAESAPEALRQSIELAKLGDELGFHRYWVAEHHESEGFACGTPELFICRVGAETKRIRIGSGGVMLNHYSPYKVAESFQLLENLYPGRVDLAVGRAPGGGPAASQALAYGAPTTGAEYYPGKIADLKAFVAQGKPANDIFEGLHAYPLSDNPPAVWSLGSSTDSAKLAAQFGLPYCFAHFLNADSARKAAKLYHDNFEPSEVLNKPHMCLGVFTVCAETSEQAEREAQSRDLWRVKVGQTGMPGPYPSREEIDAYPFSEYDRQVIRENRKNMVIGSPQQIKSQFLALADELKLDEIICLTNLSTHEARRRSYSLIAEAFSLKAT